MAVRLGGCLALLAAAALLLARTAPRDLPHGWHDLGRWLAESPPETPILALATLAAYGCILWLAVVLLAVAAGSGAGWVPPGLRQAAERLLGVALVTATAGVLAAGPALADGPSRPGSGPFDRPVVTSVTPPATSAEGAGPFDRIATPAAAVPAVRAVPRDEVVVHRGDTLWDIAERHLGPDATPAEVAAAWPRWYAANRAVIGADPNVILPGQRLVAPAAAGGAR